MRVRIDGGNEGQAALIARALAANGFAIAEGGDPCDLVLTVGERAPTRVELGDVVVDLARRRVTRQGQPIWLTPAEFSLLAYLVGADRIVARDELLREVWGLNFDPHTNSVAVHISRLRRKIGHDCILTEPNGYRIGIPGRAD